MRNKGKLPPDVEHEFARKEHYRVLAKEVLQKAQDFGIGLTEQQERSVHKQLKYPEDLFQQKEREDKERFTKDVVGLLNRDDLYQLGENLQPPLPDYFLEVGVIRQPEFIRTDYTFRNLPEVDQNWYQFLKQACERLEEKYPQFDPSLN